MGDSAKVPISEWVVGGWIPAMKYPIYLMEKQLRTRVGWKPRAHSSKGRQ